MSIADLVSGAPLDAEAATVEQVRALLDAGASANADEPDGWAPTQIAAERGWCDLIAVLLAAGADPLAGAGQDKKDDWPLFIAANAEEVDAAWTLLPASIAAYAASLEVPPAVGEAVWLEKAWELHIGDPQIESETLVQVQDGWGGGVGVSLVALPLKNGYRAYLEAVATGPLDFSGAPVIRGFAREKRKAKVAAHDREAVRRSLTGGYLSDVSRALDLNFQGVRHDVQGRYARMFK